MSPPRRSCIYPGCSSVQGNGSVSLFKFPSDDNLRKRWIDFVMRSNCGKFKITTNTRLCSVHFTPDSYCNYHQVKSGFLKSPLTLASGAEPTLSVPGVHPTVLPTADATIMAPGITCPPPTLTVPPTAGSTLTVTGITCPPQSAKKSPPITREAVCRCGYVKKDTREIGCQTDHFVEQRNVAKQPSNRTLVNRSSPGYQSDPNMDETEELLESEQLLPEHLHIKDEPETQETNSAACPFKCEDEDEKPQTSQVHWRQQTQINIKEETSSCTLNELMKNQSMGINNKEPETARNPDLSSLVLQGPDGTETDSSHTEDSNINEYDDDDDDDDDAVFDSSPKPLSDFDVETNDFDSTRKKRKMSDSSKNVQDCDSLQKPLSDAEASNMIGSAVGKSFQCSFCGKCFKGMLNLAQHEIIHTGEKPFKCDVCSKGFKRKSHLNQHEIVHTEGKPLRCDFCSKCFKTYSGLNIHKRIHTGEKPYKCAVCSKCFKNNYDLSIHKRIHTGEKPYRCDVCSKCFKQTFELNSHMKVHTGERPYKCDICSKCFKRKSELPLHMKVHTQEKPFIFHVSGKVFNETSDLDKP